jgi:hypothetical protein
MGNEDMSRKRRKTKKTFGGGAEGGRYELLHKNSRKFVGTCEYVTILFVNVEYTFFLFPCFSFLFLCILILFLVSLCVVGVPKRIKWMR